MGDRLDKEGWGSLLLGALGFLCLVLGAIASQRWLLQRNGVDIASDAPGNGLARSGESKTGGASRTPFLRVTRDSRGVVLQGAVPDARIREKILRRAEIRFGSEQVQNQLSIDPSIPATPAIERLAAWFPPSLEGIQTGELQVLGDTISLYGEAQSQAAVQKMEDELKRVIGEDMELHNLLQVAKGLSSRSMSGRIGSVVVISHSGKGPSAEGVQ